MNNRIKLILGWVVLSIGNTEVFPVTDIMVNGTLDSRINIVFMGDGYILNNMDNFINIEHAKRSGTSRLLYKGILDGQSRAVFGVTVLVHKDAQHTDAQQTDKNLLLSEDAEVDSKPSLFIYADDVKCGHGATAGHIDAETLFYMRSRGLDLETAGRILIQAYAGEIIDKVSSDG